MNDGKIAVRYAKALLSSALEQDKLDPVRSDMDAILKIINEVPELKELLQNPVIEPSRKDAVLTAVMKGKIDPLSMDFICMTIKNKREEFIPSMARMYLEFYKEEKGIRSVTVTTALQVGEEIRNTLMNMIEDAYNAKVELTEDVDDKLIGGFVLKIEDMQLDASVAGQLRRIRQDLLSAPVVKTEKK